MTTAPVPPIPQAPQVQMPSTLPDVGQTTDPSALLPDLPPLPEEKNQSSTFLNLLVGILVVVAGGVASYYLISSMHKGNNLPTTSMTKPPAEETVKLTVQYNNPFTPKVQFTNPFSTPSANPFSTLASQ